MRSAVLLLAGLLAIAMPCIAHAQGYSYPSVTRGRYLAIVGDCAACHTAPGEVSFAGGLAIETPFGNIVSSNITPDRETGIGGWSDDQFIRAVARGIGIHGEHLYPAMPYNDYVKATDRDLLDIEAFLDTLQPVRNPMVSDQLPFPFNIRLIMLGWNMLFFDKRPFQPVSGKSAEWNRGAYLATGLGHCTACHTPKNLLGGDKTSQLLRGGVLQGWYAPALDNDPRTGLGGWSADDIVHYLKTGASVHTVASGPMADAVTNSTSHMTDADLRAIAVYLKDQPGPSGQAPAAVSAQDKTMQAGKAVYEDNCAACHAGSGVGVPVMVSALKGSAGAQAAEPTSLLRVILVGARGAVTQGNPTGAAMPAFSWKLTDEQIAAVATYIRNAWGNAASAVSASDARSARNALKARTALSNAAD